MSSSIYLIKSGFYCKIGKSNDVDKRLRGLQTSSPFALELLWSAQFDTEEAALKAEADLHEVFKSRRTRGEWFWYHPEIEAEFVLLGDEVSRLSASTMADWFRAFLGFRVPAAMHPDVDINCLGTQFSAPVMKDAASCEFGFTIPWMEDGPEGFYRIAPDGAVTTISLDGEMRHWTKKRCDRVVDGYKGRACTMYREAKSALSKLTKLSAFGVMSAEKLYNVILAGTSGRPERPDFPDTDLFEAAIDEWNTTTGAIDDLMKMGFVVPLTTSRWFGEPDDPAFVWPVPAPAIKTRNRQLPAPTVPVMERARRAEVLAS